ncbi:MAG: CRISPR-associated protein Cas4 [Crenarchaeota archaeon]|nr:CRISPR-associated protein Cas4 [Thermoproteota archaeon]
MRSVIDVIINYYISESLNRVLKDNGYVFVTELVGCPLKHYLRKRYPSLSLQLNFNEKILLGKIVHEGIEAILSRIEYMVDDIQVEVPVTREVNGVTLVGRADIVTSDAVVELKTTRSTKELPHENHKLQAAIYAKLFDKPRAILVYIVLNNETKILEYEIEPIDDEMLKQLIKELKEGKPAPRYPWECNYCIFRQFCPVKQVNKNGQG